MKSELIQFQNASADDLLIVCPIEKEEKTSLCESFSMIGKPFSILFLTAYSWNDDLTPYPLKSPFGHGWFKGNGKAFLKAVEEEVKKLGHNPKKAAIAGYSLAGLFALYAFLASPLFSMAASCSGSLWYTDFLTEIRKSEKRSGYVYLSLGEKEKQAKNPCLQSVEEKTISAQKILQDLGIEADFVLNPGNHFQDAEKRLSAGISSLVLHSRL